MEREIKFRAWDENHEKMIFSTTREEGYSFEFDADGVLHCYFWERDGAGVSQPTDVGPVMQFTGLKDKDFWKDDILESADGLRRFIVTWNSGRGCWYLSGIGKAWDVPTPDWDAYSKLGNKWDNPELLDEAKVHNGT